MGALVLAYVPVLHAGYERFFNQFAGQAVGVLGPTTYAFEPLFQKLGREIRALSPETACTMLRSLAAHPSVQVYEAQDLAQLNAAQAVVMPDEDVSRYVAGQYLQSQDVQFVSVFLRYDMPRTYTQLPPTADRTVQMDDLRALFDRIHQEEAKSPDWWRQVGALCANPSGQVLYSEHNHHMPSQHSLYALGDPRNNVKAGEHLDISCAHHAERSIIAQAAHDGVPLKGSYLYITTFPCPSCAYSIVRAGIERVCYTGGYSALEGAETMRAYGVELIHVVD